MTLSLLVKYFCLIDDRPSCEVSVLYRNISLVVLVAAIDYPLSWYVIRLDKKEINKTLNVVISF